MDDLKLIVGSIGSSDFGEPGNDYLPIFEGDDHTPDQERDDSPTRLPILPLRNMVLFPGVIVPISIGREKSLKLVREAQRGGTLIGAVAQVDVNVNDPGSADIYRVGTTARVLKVLEMPDGSTTVIIQGRKRFRWEEISAVDPFLEATVEMLEDVVPRDDDKREFEAIIGSLKDLALRIIKGSSPLAPEAAFAVKNIDSPTFLINYIGSNIDAKVVEKQQLLELSDLMARGQAIMGHLVRELQLLEIKNDIQSKVKMDMDQQQREYLLQQQIKTIQDELGTSPVEQEVKVMEALAAKKKWGSEVEACFRKELEKVRRLNPAAGEYSVQLNYLQTMLDLPWNEYTNDNFDLARAQRVLDRDHHGLDNVKERILEHLAVLKLKGDLKSPIICLHGPPGVGKTSLGKSVAEALGRQYVRMSLGGLHDEAEIRGHRKTYVGAMPGRIIQSIKKAGSANPVFILDEIDKIGKSFQGDPASALLEVLDPEQNSSFHDNFLDVDFDLSKVMFIATSNTLSTIAGPLLDRMELIEVSGYILEEKVEIARRHLIPKLMDAHGIPKGSFVLSRQVIEFIVDAYTRESGVRELDKVLARLFRKLALRVASGEKTRKNITMADARVLLGIPRFSKEVLGKEEFTGVATGLAWTATGGEVLFVESSLSKGKGVLTLTGNLGDVMKESAVLALEYIKAHATEIGIDENLPGQCNVHVHVPAGAIPKDGPSAGITMIVSMASAFSSRRVKPRLAMTGEITLRGKVLAVGGIKEKILAAKRAGITDVVLSEENRKDVEEIKQVYVEGLNIHYAGNVMDVLELSLA